VIGAHLIGQCLKGTFQAKELLLPGFHIDGDRNILWFLTAEPLPQEAHRFLLLCAVFSQGSAILT
jgi:hypothetical protein